MKQPHDTNILLGMQTILPKDLHIQLLDSEIVIVTGKTVQVSTASVIINVSVALTHNDVHI